MKNIMSLLLILSTWITLPSQEKEMKKKEPPVVEKKAEPAKPVTLPPEVNARPIRARKARIPDSARPGFLNFQNGIAVGVMDTSGINLTLTYERKLPNSQFAWFANYTFGYVAESDYEESNNYNDNPNSNYFVYSSTLTEELSISYHHFGGGFHYYLLNFDRQLKLYTGVGSFVGFNKHQIEFENDGEIEDSGLDFGAYAIFGIRWCRGPVRCGFEYRGGFIQSTIFDDEKSGDMHEIVFFIGVIF